MGFPVNYLVHFLKKFTELFVKDFFIEDLDSSYLYEKLFVVSLIILNRFFIYNSNANSNSFSVSKELNIC